MDGYASASTLKEIYDYDNYEFLSYLKDKGFYIAFESRTNYASTFLSLASSLNMEYLNYLSEGVGVESKDRTIPYQMIKNNKVMKLLKSKGYKYIHFSSGWGATDRNIYADLDIWSGGKNEFLTILIQTTILSPLEKYLIGGDDRRRVLNTFSELAKVHRIEGPKFIFAHITCPHPPYLFSEDGEPVPETKFKMSGNVWEQKEKYLKQLIFISNKVKILTDEILSQSKDLPIIILQADHGTASTFYGPDVGDWDRPSKINLRERMRIFNAFYFPSGGNSLLYSSITPVNVFKIIFNYYFKKKYELLEDQSYYSTYQQPYRFVNVTDMVTYDGRVK